MPLFQSRRGSTTNLLLILFVRGHIGAGPSPVSHGIAGTLRRMQPRCQRYRGGLQSRKQRANVVPPPLPPRDIRRCLPGRVLQPGARSRIQQCLGSAVHSEPRREVQRRLARLVDGARKLGSADPRRLGDAQRTRDRDGAEATAAVPVPSRNEVTKRGREQTLRCGRERAAERCGRVSRSRDVRVSDGDPRRAVRAGLDRGSADAPQLLRAVVLIAHPELPRVHAHSGIDDAGCEGVSRAHDRCGPNRRLACKQLFSEAVWMRRKTN